MKKVIPKSKIDRIIAKRGKVYGDPKKSHINIGLSWTGLIQQHYGITLEHPIPASLACAMLVNLKMQRACRVFHADNFDDAHAYTQFAQEFQKQEQG